MKKLALIIIFLLFSTIALAQDLSINLVSYDPETGNARIQITNTASTDFHDLKMSIEDSTRISIAPILRAGSSISTFLIIPTGEHEITLTVREGTGITKKLYFPQTKEQIREEIEQQRQITEKQKNIQEEIEKLAQQKIPTQTKKSASKFYFYILFIFIALIIFYLLYKKFKTKEKFQKQ